MPYIVQGKPVDMGIEFMPEGSLKKPYELIYNYVRLCDGWFDYTWITHHPWNADPFITIANLSTMTRHIMFGVGVTNPFVIPPVCIAETSGTLYRMLGQRYILGIGAGDPESIFYVQGQRPEKPVKAMKEAIIEIKSLLSGLEVRGKKFTWLEREVEVPPPQVFIGAQGPLMLRLAGELGDGVLLNASHPKYVKFAIEQVKMGVEKAGKTKMPKIAVYTCFSMGDDAEKAEDFARAPIAFIVAGAPQSVLDIYSINKSDAEKISGFLRDGKFPEAFDSVSKEMIDVFSVSGTPDVCRKKLEDLAGGGVDQFVFGSPLGPEVKKEERGLKIKTKEQAVREIISKILNQYSKVF